MIKLLTPNPAEFTPGVQRLAREHPQSRAGAGVRHQALLPARVGRGLAQPFQRRHHQRRARARAQVRGPAAGRQLPAHRPARRTAPGAPTSCGRTSSRPTRSRWRTTSPRRWSCRRAGWSACPREYDGHPSLKLSENCEFRLFQRPDDAIHPGLDQQTEEDMSGAGPVLLELPAARPGRRGAASSRTSRVHDAFTEPMRDARRPRNAARDGRRATRSARPSPRLSTASPPRTRATCRSAPTSRTRATATWPRWVPGSTAGCPCTQPVVFPVISVLSGRRNNPPEEGIRPLCVYGPIHYQELPELFMDYVCSLTGKSPSTTGAGSEGALTKGPFNALARDRRSQQRARVDAALRLRRLQLARPASSARATAWTTTSAC